MLQSISSANAGEHNEYLQRLGKPHVDSFDFFTENGLKYAVGDLWPVEFTLTNGTIVKLQILSASVHPPLYIDIFGKVKETYPAECRQSNLTYTGRLEIHMSWYLNEKPQMPIEMNANIPLMLRSRLCNLCNLSPAQLVRKGEHADEWGGYFVVKGKERLSRMLLHTRRNFPIAVKRSSWKDRGVHFSDLGVMIKCISYDHTTVNNVLHFLTNGSAKLMFSLNRHLFYAPIMLIIRCLVSYTDEFIFKHLVAGCDDEYFKGCIIDMMRSLHENDIHDQRSARHYLGDLIQVKLHEMFPFYKEEDCCAFILKRCILIHLEDNFDKFLLLVLMLKKLISVVRGNSLVENQDSIMFQELLMGGHLYLKIMKEKLQNLLLDVKRNILRYDSSSFILDETTLRKCLKPLYLEKSLSNFFATGNLVSASGLGLQQHKGLTILVENISRMRYMSHFHAIHRGAIFEEMRITEPRQLLPDAWGFICPVHTPDGTPCGLLNHITRTCEVSTTVSPEVLTRLPETLVALGMECVGKSAHNDACSVYSVILEGRVVGHVLKNVAENFVQKLRVLKIKGLDVPKTLEIVLLSGSEGEATRQFPGLYLFLGDARMIRPVLNLTAGGIELIGTFEQVYLDICMTAKDMIPGVTTHMELSKSDFLSYAASLIPLPDYNQSPRNMYQCQMGKQTMGMAIHNWQQKADGKLYRLQTPASPLFKPAYYDLLAMDDFAMGTNAVVAVVSYTGYDMEDALIINRAALDRGFAHGSVYKSDFIELKPNAYFAADVAKMDRVKFDVDGLPLVGAMLKEQDFYYSYFDEQLQTYSLGKYTGKEEARVDAVRLCESNGRAKACVSLRIQRNPTVGDKFASRAGQKGIFSFGWRMEDLPFTESGLVPDIVFNPHGFPSRMTIAMMIECMAGKSACISGTKHDASPFMFDSESLEGSAIDHFGNLLSANGYNYFGQERMYSGIDGTEMSASIFFGVVHYQRLRHMVSDKWQVRSTGPYDIVTRQPLKGRKRGGGGRVGEMERDALIAHGAPSLIRDRFLECSDKSTALWCANCLTLVGPTTILAKGRDDHTTRIRTQCRLCNKSDIKEISVPHIFRYLCTELAAVNIKLKFHVKEE